MIIDPVCADLCSPEIYVNTFLQMGYNLGQCKDYNFDIFVRSEVIKIGSDKITINFYMQKQEDSIQLGGKVKSFLEIKTCPSNCKSIFYWRDFICTQTCISEIYLNFFAESLNYTEGFCKNIGYNKFLKNVEMKFNNDLPFLNISYYMKEEFNLNDFFLSILNSKFKESCIQFYNIIDETICEEICIDNYLDFIEYNKILLNFQKGNCREFMFNILEKTKKDNNLKKYVYLKE